MDWFSTDSTSLLRITWHHTIAQSDRPDNRIHRARFNEKLTHTSEGYMIIVPSATPFGMEPNLCDRWCLNNESGDSP